MKLKSMPSLKGNKRYLTFKLHSERPVVYSEMKGAVENSILNWMGEAKRADAGCRIIKNLWDFRNQTGWIECSHRSVDDTKMSLALIHQIGDSRVIFHVLRVSGTIRSGKEKIFK